jgi:hypothetical protein
MTAVAWAVVRWESYKNCTEARAAGVTPIHKGDPGSRFGLDRDGDGIASLSSREGVLTVA